MDNFLTCRMVISVFRNLGIGVVGTVRFQTVWTPSNLKNIKDCHSNDFFGCFIIAAPLLPGEWTMEWYFVLPALSIARTKD